MAESCDRPPANPARARVRTLATEALAAGAPTAWFETLYREADGDPTRIPWADLAPNAALSAWVARPGALAGRRTAAVVGCGLGHDAELLAAQGLDVLAFDVSPAAVAWARRVHPGSRVRYEVGDLFALPQAWTGRFDLVVEIYTLQALPERVRGDAARAIVGLVAPAGRLFVFTRVRDDAPGTPPLCEKSSGPPWPLGRAELRRLVSPLVEAEPFVEVPDAADATLIRAHGAFARRA